MKSLMETYTPLIKKLQDLNQEIRQRHLSMHLSTEQEMQNLGVWLEEIGKVVNDLDNSSLIITHHLKLLETKYKEHQASTGSRE